MPTFNDHLRWRYATKKFDATKKLTQAQIDELLETLRLTPSSFGLQPYKFLVIENAAVRLKLREHGWNQTQITDASHLIAICSYRTIDQAFVDRNLDLISRERNIPLESLKGYREKIAGYLLKRTPEQIGEWAKRQGYIALGILLSACAAMEIDSCPMEGFDPVLVDEDLDLKKDNLTIVALCPVGYRAGDDDFATLAKVRFPREQMVEVRK